MQAKPELKSVFFASDDEKEEAFLKQTVEDQKPVREDVRAEKPVAFSIRKTRRKSLLVGRPWTSLGEDQRRTSQLGKYLQWAFPVYVLCSAAFIAYTQVSTVGASRLEITDNNQDVLNSQVKEYSNVDNVKMTFEAGATVLGLLIGWSALVFPHLVHGIFLMVWLLPMPHQLRGTVIFLLSQFGKMVWALVVNSGIAVIAFMIKIVVNARDIEENVTLQLYQTASDLSYGQDGAFCLMIISAQWLLHLDRISAASGDEASSGSDGERGRELGGGEEPGKGEEEEKIASEEISPIPAHAPEHPRPELKFGDVKGWEEEEEEESPSSRNNGSNNDLTAPLAGDGRRGRGEAGNCPASEWCEAIGWAKVRGESLPRRRQVFWGFFVYSLLAMGLAGAAMSATFAKITLEGIAAALSPEDSKLVVYAKFPHDASRKLGAPARTNFSIVLDWWILFIAPISAGALVLLMWVVPATRRWRRRGRYLVEILSGWSCLELWFLTSCISLTSLRILCDAILSDIQACDTLARTGTKCFSVKAELSSDAWWMVISALLHRFMLFLFMARARVAMEEEEAVRGSSAQHTDIATTTSTQPEVVVGPPNFTNESGVRI